VLKLLKSGAILPQGRILLIVTRTLLFQNNSDFLKGAILCSYELTWLLPTEEKQQSRRLAESHPDGMQHSLP
jgi:hypothetical protein